MYDSRSFSPSPLSRPSAGEDNHVASRQLVAALLDAWNEHDLERVASFYAPDYEGTDIAQPGPQLGRADIRRTTAYYFRAFPDLHVSQEDLVLARDHAVIAWTWRGTHRGTFMRIPPTGRAVVVRGITILSIQDGLIRRGQRVWDLAGLLRDIGLLPDL
jgi:steroid delta-isomerase-like uncharacterized protein